MFSFGDPSVCHRSDPKGLAIRHFNETETDSETFHDRINQREKTKDQLKAECDPMNVSRRVLHEDRKSVV